MPSAFLNSMWEYSVLFQNPNSPEELARSTVRHSPLCEFVPDLFLKLGIVMKTPHALGNTTIVKGASRNEAKEAKQPLCFALLRAGPWTLSTESTESMWFKPSF